MPGHNPNQFVYELSLKLASRSRHVCVFVGAGASKACGLPDVSKLEEGVKQRLEPVDRELFSKQLEKRNLEQALSRIRRIASLTEGESEFEGLNHAKATRLDQKVCQAIISELMTEAEDLEPFHRFAAWASHAEYLLPLEIFTVNYDLLIETAFEKMRVPYFDGFVGNLRGRFRTELVEGTPDDKEHWLLPSFVRLWKLHGSVNWTWDTSPESEIVRIGMPVSGTAAAIYPSDDKYDESRRVPFLVLQDRFRRALAHPETITLVTGYSFSDEHLNELLFDAARRRPRSETIVFCYSDIPKELKRQAELHPNLQVVAPDRAILGGRNACWDQFEDDHAPSGFWDQGRFTLGDFGSLSAHLARISPSFGSETAPGSDEALNG